jgi:ferric-dicitrate binding protein FerR (iron transport regulator)
MNFEQYLSLRNKQRRGALNHDEQTALQHWLQSAEGKAVQQVEQLADRYQSSYEPDVEAGLARLQARIRAAKVQEGSTLRVAARGSWIRLAAAVLILAIGIIAMRNWLVAEPAMMQVTTSATENRSVTLTDGAKIQLNANAQLRFPGKFSATEPHTVQFLGEGYFDIPSATAQSFVVKTAALTLLAQGTAFNLRAYPTEFTTEVEVEKGMVQMAVGKQKIYVASQEKGIYDRQARKLYKRKARQLNAQSWRTHRLEFKDAPLSEIMQELSRYHRVRIELPDNKVLQQCAYTTNFDKTKLEDALKVLQISLNLRWERLGADHYVIRSGSCE